MQAPLIRASARYIAAGSRVVRTDEAGTVTFLADEDGIRIETWRTTHARYRHFGCWRVVQF